MASLLPPKLPQTQTPWERPMVMTYPWGWQAVNEVVDIGRSGPDRLDYKCVHGVIFHFLTGQVSNSALIAKHIVVGGSRAPGQPNAMVSKGDTVKEGPRPRGAGTSSKPNGVPFMPSKGSAEDRSGRHKVRQACGSMSEQ